MREFYNNLSEKSKNRLTITAIIVFGGLPLIAGLFVLYLIYIYLAFSGTLVYYGIFLNLRNKEKYETVILFSSYYILVTIIAFGGFYRSNDMNLTDLIGSFVAYSIILGVPVLIFQAFVLTPRQLKENGADEKKLHEIRNEAEIFESRCRNCKSVLNLGKFCNGCGTRY